jgi:hypothetical protein
MKAPMPATVANRSVGGNAASIIVRRTEKLKRSPMQPPRKTAPRAVCQGTPSPRTMVWAK